MTSPSLNSRLQVGPDRCTLLFIGQVEGTKGLWWGVEWDDPKRGKHDGTHSDGKRYYQTRQPGAGSFIRPTSPKIILPKPFLPALQGRYTSSTFAPAASARSEPLRNEIPLHLGNTKIEVEAPNLAKVHKRLGNVVELKELGVDGESVGTMSEEEGKEMDAMGEWNVRSLNLSQSLFPSFEVVEMIVQHLQNLESLNLNSNRFPALPTAICLPSFSRIQYLTLSNTLMSWDEMMRLEPSLPNLRQLEFSSNQVSTLCLTSVNHEIIPSSPPQPARQPFPNLTHLQLNSNSLSNWSSLSPLSHLSSLLSLSLTYNDLPSLPPPTPSSPSPFPSSLTTLSLSFNKIKSWSSIDVLGSLPLAHGKGLAEIWVRGNGFVEGTPGGLVRAGLIARLRGLEVLEGSEVTKGERKDAEVFYLSLNPTYDEDDVGRKRWEELVEKHGLPDPKARNASSKPPPILRDKLIDITVQTSPTPSPSGGIPLQILPKMSVRMLKLKLQKLTGMKATSMRLCLLDVMKDGSERREEMDEDKKEVASFGVEGGSRLVVESW